MALLLKVSGCFRNKTFAVSVESTIKSYRTSLTKWMRKPKESKIQWALAASGVTFTKLVFDCKIAKCQVINSKAKDVGMPINNSVPEEQKEKDFPWIQFLTYIWPHIFALTVAIVSALAVAILNTKIGISIGSLETEISKAQKYNELLGLGIGIFQSGTMLFLNGIVLSTLYYGGYLLAIQELYVVMS